MTKVEMRQLVYDGLAPLFRGLKLSKKAEGFVRKVDGGTQTVGVPFIDRRPLFKFSLIFSIRLEAVQAIVNQFSGTVPKYFAITLTSATRLDYFFPGVEKKEFEVQSEADVETAIQQLAPLARERLVPFLDEHRTVEGLNRSMNFGDPKFDRLNEPYRSMAALTVAYVANEPRFDELVTRYRLQVQSCQPHDREKLSKLIAHLEAMASTQAADPRG